ncbi:MAG: saccharopine dehydrogenase C-terminal domain-containing protein [Candidatus Woesearchaeota archaeon]
MGYSYLVIGAGMMGEAIAYDLLQDSETTKVIIVDRLKHVAEHIQQKLRDSRIIANAADASNSEEMKQLMQNVDVAIGAASYDYNEILAKAAIETSTHFCDLGGNNRIVEKEFLFDEHAKKAGVKIIPDCGIAPGAVSTIVAYGIEEMGMPDAVHIRVGGLPAHPQGPLNYMKVFSVRGLINEYKEDTEVLEDGELCLKKSMQEIEPIVFHDSRFKDNILHLEAAYTSGGSSTLAKTFKKKIRTLDYKTIRYPGHWEKIHTLEELGFFDEQIMDVRGVNVRPRDMTEQIIEKNISYHDSDMLLIRVSLIKDKKEVQYDLVDFQDEKTGHTAMQRTTGYSAAIVAQMMAKNQITDNGVLYIEKSVPPKLFIDEWAKRGLVLKKNIILLQDK